jgi:protein O-GlcNAc transferase
LADRAIFLNLLIDLIGHFASNRLKVLCPQASAGAVGFVYPNTTGLSAIEYRIVDTITDPAGAEAFCMSG